MTSVVETTDPAEQRVPLTLRQEFEARLEAYAATCRLRRPVPECDEAFQAFRDVFIRFHEALWKAQAEIAREESRKKARAVR